MMGLNGPVEAKIWPDDELRVCAQKYIKTAIKQQKRDIPKPPLAD
jgi:hypothetical protein